MIVWSIGPAQVGSKTSPLQGISGQGSVFFPVEVFFLASHKVKGYPYPNGLSGKKLE